MAFRPSPPATPCGSLFGGVPDRRLCLLASPSGLPLLLSWIPHGEVVHDQVVASAVEGGDPRAGLEPCRLIEGSRRAEIAAGGGGPGEPPAPPPPGAAGGPPPTRP